MATTRGGWTATGTGAERRRVIAANRGERAQRARQGLLDAARVVFARKGFLDATVEDVVTEAGVARGTFYTYFESKAHLFRHLASTIDEQVEREVVTFPRRPGAGVVANLETSNRNYLAVVRAHADLYRLVDQVAAYDETVRKARLRSRQHHVARVATSIRRWQRRGLADPAVDADTTAALLVSMLSGFAQWLHVAGDDHDEERSVVRLTEIWVQACGLRGDGAGP